MLPIDQRRKVETIDIGRQSAERVERTVVTPPIDQANITVGRNHLVAELDRGVERQAAFTVFLLPLAVDDEIIGNQWVGAEVDRAQLGDGGKTSGYPTPIVARDRRFEQGRAHRLAHGPFDEGQFLIIGQQHGSKHPDRGALA